MRKERLDNLANEDRGAAFLETGSQDPTKRIADKKGAEGPRALKVRQKLHQKDLTPKALSGM